jgi:hypothetical protein
MNALLGRADNTRKRKRVTFELPDVSQDLDPEKIRDLKQPPALGDVPATLLADILLY